MRPRRTFMFFIALLVMVSLACIGGLSGAGETKPTGNQGAQPAISQPQQQQQQNQPPVLQPSQGGRPARSYEEAENAVVKIIATGTIAALEADGRLVPNVEWGGSGFIIDPSGIAVTNNHVVTGAATLKVYIAGDIRKEFPARVIAASECMDLAVIQIEGGPFPTYLEWYTGPVDVGMEVYAAGFPLIGGNDYQYTLTKGIISRTREDGRATWASMDYVYLHDARTRGGNSGGPLITPDAKVVAVNYAGADEMDINLAIPGELARPVVEQLRQGRFYRWVGVNGEAIGFTINGVEGRGIWVASVETGSPADKVGLKPGDIIIEMENIQVALDGTMSQYCEILASRDVTAPIKIKVLRWETGEILEGTLNGEPLKLVSAPSGGGMTSGGGQSGGQGQQGDFTVWTDITESIVVAAPSSWQDTDGTLWELQEGVAASLMVAPNLQAFTNFQGPGIWVTASEDFAKVVGYVQMLDWFKVNVYQDNCKYEGRVNYEDELYRGKADIWSRCGPSRQVEALVMAVRPKGGSNLPEFFMTVVVHVTPNEDADTLLQMVFDTFNVVGALP